MGLAQPSSDLKVKEFLLSRMKGLNEMFSRDDEFLIRMDDLEMVEEGAAFNRFSQEFSDPTGQLRFLMDFIQSNGTRQILVVSETGVIYTVNSVGVDALLSGTMATGSEFADGTVFNDLAVLVRGGNAPRKYTGSGGATAALGGSPPSAYYVESLRNFVFMAATTTNRSRLFWSAVGNAESWTTGTDFVDVNPDDGSVITGIVAMEDSLLILKERKLYKLIWSTNPTDDGRIVLLSQDIGSRTNQGARLHNGVLYFLSQKPSELYAWDGATLKNLSRGRITGRKDDGTFEEFDATWVLGVIPVFDELYLGDKTAVQYKYSLTRNQWSRFMGFASPNPTWSEVAGTFLGPRDNQVMKMNTTFDGSSSIGTRSPVLQTAFSPLSSFEIEKQIERIEVVYVSLLATPPSVTLAVIGQEGTTLFSEAKTLAVSASIDDLRKAVWDVVGGSCKTASVKLSWSQTVLSYIMIEKITVYYRDMGIWE